MSDRPLNFTDIRESFEIAMVAHDDVPTEAAYEIAATVEEAVANNERDLMWKSDYEDFVGAVDGVLDSLAGNGYDKEIERIDNLQTTLEANNE